MYGEGVVTRDSCTCTCMSRLMYGEGVVTRDSCTCRLMYGEGVINHMIHVHVHKCVTSC